MSLQSRVFSVVKAFAGQGNILAVPVIFIKVTGTVEAALMLSQLVYWQDRSSGWIYKSLKDWEEELCLSRRAVERATKLLKSLGLIETELRKGANGAPTTHYRVVEERLVELVFATLGPGGGGDRGSEHVDRDLPEDRGPEGREGNSQENAENALPDVYKSICAICTNPFARSVQMDLRDLCKSTLSIETTSKTTSEKVVNTRALTRACVNVTNPEEIRQWKNKGKSNPRGAILTEEQQELFNKFWKVYPKKRSKGEAQRAWARLDPDAELFAEIMAGLERAKASPDWRKEGGRYIPYPARWLDGRGWEDEYDPPARSPDPPKSNLIELDPEVVAIWRERIQRAKQEAREARARAASASRTTEPGG